MSELPDARAIVTDWNIRLSRSYFAGLDAERHYSCRGMHPGTEASINARQQEGQMELTYRYALVGQDALPQYRELYKGIRNRAKKISSRVTARERDRHRAPEFFALAALGYALSRS